MRSTLAKDFQEEFDAPLATTGGSVKFGVLFTITSSLTIRFILSRSPRADCSVASNSMAMPRAACLPSSMVICSPILPDQGLPSFFARRPDK